MELGQKLRKARLEAGLSQRALCGNQITRNMLSQIENGSAKPSMATLQYLAQRLGKSVSFFLEETVVTSANMAVMDRARALYDASDWEGAAQALKDYREPDPVYDREKRMLWVLLCLNRAREALAQGKAPYARTLLEQAQLRTPYCWEMLERQRLLILGMIPGEKVCARLPSLDPELLLRAQEALDAQELQRAEALLEAVENRRSHRWNLLRGEVYFRQGDYESARACFLLARDGDAQQAIQRLEHCCRELGDYKAAYEYAMLRMGSAGAAGPTANAR